MCGCKAHGDPRALCTCKCWAHATIRQTQRAAGVSDPTLPEVRANMKPIVNRIDRDVAHAVAAEREAIARWFETHTGGGWGEPTYDNTTGKRTGLSVAQLVAHEIRSGAHNADLRGREG